jgi:hypothetical protein
MKVTAKSDRTHNPFDETYRVSGLRENLTSSSKGEGLETGLRSTLNGHAGGNPGDSQGQSYGVPRQSFTRQSFFKLMKSAGHQLEAWQQESALAIAKRLLVASMACVTVWEIAADKSAQAAGLRDVLIKLSGRQMRHKTAFTYPALLAGLWVFLSMREVMQTYSQEELYRLKETVGQFLGRDV